MGDMFQVKVKGLKELEQKFKEIDISMQKVLAEATAQGAAVVAREAKINSRKGGDDFPNKITGNLMRSIKPLYVIMEPTRCEIQVGSAMIYARRLEYGFMDKDKRGRQFHQKPRPFLRPALDENEAKVQRAFNLQVKEFLRLVT
jgi:HK97 gp10 family phage protein